MARQPAWAQPLLGLRRGLGREGQTIRRWAALLAGFPLLVLAGAVPDAAAREQGWGNWQEWGNWRWGELRARIDSTVSVSANLRTQDRHCDQIATINGGCNPLATPAAIAAGEDNALFTEGQLLNQDDGNLNYDRGDFFSVLFKGTHDVEVDWRNYAAFVRFSWFADALQAQAGSTERTDLSHDARFRDNVLVGGVVGAHFLLLDAYLNANWSRWNRSFSFRVGNQVVNWGESLFAQGGINSINTLDVTKIRLPGSELKEALLPAPMVKAGGDIIPNLSFDAYYQFGWRKTELDPVGTFFSTNDLVSRGAQGQFQPLPDAVLGPITIPLAPGCGDPGTPEAQRKVSPACPAFPTLRNLLSFPNGLPFRGFDDASNQGQFGAALRYYIEQIETELSIQYIRLHHKFPVVSHSGIDTQLADCVAFNASPVGPLPPQPGCDVGYDVVYPEKVDLAGFSFNTLVGGVAVAGELSYRWGEPQPVVFDNSYCNNANPGACVPGAPQRLASVNALIDSLGLNPGASGVFAGCGGPAPAAGCGGGRVPGYARLDRIVGILNALYIVSKGTPWVGWIPQYAHADDMTFIVEAAVTSFPDLDQCPTDDAALPAHPGCQRYAAPLGVQKVDDVGWGYTLRLAATYDRIFGTPVSFLPAVAFQHQVHGTQPLSEASFTEGVKSIGVTLEFNYQQRVWLQLSYSNSFGAGMRNANSDRDFAGASLSYAF